MCFLGLDFTKITGDSRITLDLINELASDFDIFLILLGKFDPSLFDVNEKIKIKCFNESRDMSIKKIIYKTFIKVIRYIYVKKIEVVVSSGSFSGPILLIIKILNKLKILKLKIIFWEHEIISNRSFKSMIIRKICWKSCDFIVVITKKTFEKYKLKVKNKKILQIYNFSNFKIRNPVYDINSKSLITVGRLDPVKGFDLAILAAKKVFEKHSDWIWNIYGEGILKKTLKEQIKKNNLEKNVFLKGSFSNIYDEYPKHAVYVLTSRFEGFSLSLLEAKISALPVVSFNCPSGPCEILNNNIDGFLVKCYDVDSLAEKIIFLIENLDTRIEFSRNSSENLKKFDKKTILDKWIFLFKNIENLNVLKIKE